MSPLMFLAVLFVWVNLAFQVFIAVEFGVNIWRALMVGLAVGCAVITTGSALRN